MSATISEIPILHSMPDDARIAVCTAWREGVDGAFKAIEFVFPTVQLYLQRVFIFIAAVFANAHGQNLLSSIIKQEANHDRSNCVCHPT